MGWNGQWPTATSCTWWLSTLAGTTPTGILCMMRPGAPCNIRCAAASCRSSIRYLGRPRPCAPNVQHLVLYEQNIGLLQPLLADELRLAEQANIRSTGWKQRFVKRSCVTSAPGVMCRLFCSVGPARAVKRLCRNVSRSARPQAPNLLRPKPLKKPRNLENGPIRSITEDRTLPIRGAFCTTQEVMR